MIRTYVHIWDNFFLPVHFSLQMSKNWFLARAATPKPLMLVTWNFRYHLVTVVGHSNCLFMSGNGRLNPFFNWVKIAKNAIFHPVEKGLKPSFPDMKRQLESPTTVTRWYLKFQVPSISGFGVGALAKKRFLDICNKKCTGKKKLSHIYSNPRLDPYVVHV